MNQIQHAFRVLYEKQTDAKEKKFLYLQNNSNRIALNRVK